MKSTVLKQLQSVQVEILDEIVRICEKYSLRYYLIGGTLLGAIRHKGFIPWDDDLDIAMPRVDYEKLCEIAPQELNEKYFLHSHKNDSKYWLSFAKIHKKNTVFITSTNIYDEKYSGIWVDIFPLDEEFSSNKSNVEKKFKFFSKLKTLAFLKANGMRQRTFWGYLLSIPLFCIKLRWIVDLQSYIMTRSKDIPDNNYYMNYGSKYGVKKQFMPCSYFEPAIKVTFENKNYDAPNQTIKVLESIYGNDYMQLPPIEKQITHNPIRLSFDLNGNDAVLE